MATMRHCSAKIASGKPCMAWARHDSDPPLCSARSGLLGAPRGNGNAVTHGFYQKKRSPGETESLIDESDPAPFRPGRCRTRPFPPVAVRDVLPLRSAPFPAQF
jgi:hypothetical protein